MGITHLEKYRNKKTHAPNLDGLHVFKEIKYICVSVNIIALGCFKFAQKALQHHSVEK
jgi:hypothetical protein